MKWSFLDRESTGDMVVDSGIRYGTSSWLQEQNQSCSTGRRPPTRPIRLAQHSVTAFRIWYL